MKELQLIDRDDLIEDQKAESISKSMVIDVLSDSEKLQIVLSNVNTYLQSELDFVKARINEVKTPADLERLDAVRKAIAKWRVDAGKNYEAMKKANRALISRADEGFDLVVNAQKAIEKSIEELLEPKKQEFEREKQRKKALSDSLKALRTKTINPLLPSDTIDAAIDDFRVDFGGADYQELQDEADSAFESKITEFESILASAKQREENERAVALEQARNKQRANIGVTFPLVEISGYEPRTANEIKARIDWTASVDMSAFNLVLPEAEAQKQACLNMLAAFLPMAVAREQEASIKVEQDLESYANRFEGGASEDSKPQADNPCDLERETEEDNDIIDPWSMITASGELKKPDLQQAGVFESEYLGGVPVNPLVDEPEASHDIVFNVELKESEIDLMLSIIRYADKCSCPYDFYDLKEKLQSFI